jgi:uncharacterized protein YbbC (DUF1343 family)
MNQLLKYAASLLFVVVVSCANNKPSKTQDQQITTKNQSVTQKGIIEAKEEPKEIIIGAARFSEYLDDLKGQKVGLIVNQTSTIAETHLVDTLISLGVNVQKIFAPEHGFRGTADAGEKVKDGKDVKTGLPIISLYGKNRKPTKAMIQDLDVLIFDIQDVGARFYTYISTMHYVMEAASENNKRVIVLDRPNPNGHYIDGPIRQKQFKSFVGMHPIPIVHGLTVGELAKMINGEHWLIAGGAADLKVVTCENYDHNTFYELPVKPSPNLPNIRAVYLYPSLCLFEGSIVSVGRGTETPFQIYGHPIFKNGTYEFTPKPTEGAKNPPYKDEVCNGFSLTSIPIEELRQTKQLQLSYFLDYYNNFPKKDIFFNDFFEKLVGNSDLRKQIKAGKTEAEIRKTWAKGLATYKAMRKNYLLYGDS